MGVAIALAVQNGGGLPVTTRRYPAASVQWTVLTTGLFLLLPGTAPAAGEKPLLLRKPAVSRTHVAFVYGDDLWLVPRTGGEARRLTSGAGLETDPVFSPDGSQIAFTAQYDGSNSDVYVMPAAGGTPRRLTYHPDPDAAVGWTPDGKNVLFRSGRSSYSRFSRLFTVPASGGFPTELPLPTAFEGSYSPDGTRIAYVPLPPAFNIWKRYRGGRASRVWLADLSDSHIEPVPRTDSNDFNPMWLGDKVYFLSDRNGPVTLFVYDPATRQVREALPNQGLDAKSASAGPDVIVYDQFGALYLFDPTDGTSRKLDVRVSGDLPSARPHFVKAAKYVIKGGISPTGARAVFEARGEILTVPADKGDPRNLTNSPGVADRDPAWSPDGKWVAYFSDESGEYQLHLREQHGQGEVRKIALGEAPSFYFGPIWSPDAKKIAYTDKRLNLWFLDVGSGVSKRVDTNPFDDADFHADWSPDNNWLVYTRQLDNYLRAVFLYDLRTGKRHQLSDGMSDARFAAFDRSGKYVFFTASTDGTALLSWGMAGLNRPLARGVYVAVLAKDASSPLAPQSDEEGKKEQGADKLDGDAKKPNGSAKGKDSAPATHLDADDVGQRILALPVPARNYTDLQTGKAGVVFLAEDPTTSGEPPGPNESRLVLHRFDLDQRKAQKFAEDMAAFQVSHDGEKVLLRQGEDWSIVGSGHAPKPGEGTLALGGVEIRVDPRAEWRQMYREVWRIERDFLYDPNAHGLDLKAAEKKYEPYLAGLASRRELTALFSEMLGELTLGHVYVQGGDVPQVPPVRGGLLGADYEVVEGRYRFARVYRGQNWHPQNRAPLTAPGVNVRPGEFLLAVNGQELHAHTNVYQAFEGTAGKAVVLKVGPRADGTGAREVTVVPLASEAVLRNLSWIEENRRKVDRLSGGRLAYVYVPDTASDGLESFNRYFFAQTNREGAIIDERFNSGGLTPDYVVDHLRRPRIGYVSTREGRDMPLPLGAIFGPKVMVINEMAGSGGDELPHYFRQTHVGPLVGKRTWGGLVGINDYPRLIDGGSVTAPSAAFWFPSGQWEVENHGVSPDVDVELDPRAVRAGHDPQLEKAVEVALELLRKDPPRPPRKPAYPNYHAAGAGTGKAGSQAGGSR
jgi:tricorn protease